jgi:hypothetical protein
MTAEQGLALGVLQRAAVNWEQANREYMDFSGDTRSDAAQPLIAARAGAREALHQAAKAFGESYL